MTEQNRIERLKDPTSFANHVLIISSSATRRPSPLCDVISHSVLIARQLVMVVDRLPLHSAPFPRLAESYLITLSSDFCGKFRRALRNIDPARSCRPCEPILAHYFIRAVTTGCFSSGTEYKGDLAPSRKKKKRRSPHWKFSALTSLVRHLTRADSTMVDPRLKEKKKKKRTNAEINAEGADGFDLHIGIISRKKISLFYRR